MSEPPPRIPAIIRAVVPMGDQVFRIRFSPGAELKWSPGDCVAVYAAEDSGISRPYSLSGAVGASEMELWVRRMEGGKVSPFLSSCREGERIWISPPFGWFRPGEPPAADKLYFATGTGIAPFLSAFLSGFAPPRQLYWGLRRPLENFEPPEGLPLSVSLSCAGETPGRITEHLPRIRFTGQTHVYACGLDRMIEEVLGYFAEQGLPESQLHRECFFTAS
ncbi:MAG: ferredoxin--NADP reductase [Kiritimatiellia bacterium]